MEMLWAAWRSEYVQTADAVAATGACLFCSLPDGPESDSLIVERGRYAFTVLNRYPYTSGHLMVSPYRHVGRLAELDGAEAAEMWRLLAGAEEALTTALAPDAFNMGANLGRAAGAGVPGHLHLHLVPRWSGDTNFMTAVAGARVVPEDLQVTRERLVAALGDIGTGR